MRNSFELPSDGSVDERSNKTSDWGDHRGAFTVISRTGTLLLVCCECFCFQLDVSWRSHKATPAHLLQRHHLPAQRGRVSVCVCVCVCLGMVWSTFNKHHCVLRTFKENLPGPLWPGSFYSRRGFIWKGHMPLLTKKEMTWRWSRWNVVNKKAVRLCSDFQRRKVTKITPSISKVWAEVISDPVRQQPLNVNQTMSSNCSFFLTATVLGLHVCKNLRWSGLQEFITLASRSIAPVTLQPWQRWGPASKWDGSVTPLWRIQPSAFKYEAKMQSRNSSNGDLV